MLLGLDVDGVVAEFGGAIIRELGLDPSKDTTWSFADSYGPEVEAYARKKLALPDTWSKAAVLPGAVELVRSLERAGVPYLWMSSFPKWAKKLRVQWLLEHLGSSATLVCTQDKPRRCRERGVTHFLDDRPRTAHALAEAGIMSYLFCTTYCGELGEHPGVTHVKSLEDFTDKIMEQWAAQADAEFAKVAYARV